MKRGDLKLVEGGDEPPTIWDSMAALFADTAYRLGVTPETVFRNYVRPRAEALVDERRARDGVS